MKRMVDHGSRDNRGRTSPSSLSREAQGADPAEGRATAVTVIRRLAHVGVVAIEQLQRMAASSGDVALEEALRKEAAPLFSGLARFSFEFTEVSDVSAEGR